jgi:hypothetical protein
MQNDNISKININLEKVAKVQNWGTTSKKSELRPGRN